MAAGTNRIRAPCETVGRGYHSAKRPPRCRPRRRPGNGSASRPRTRFRPHVLNAKSIHNTSDPRRDVPDTNPSSDIFFPGAQMRLDAPARWRQLPWKLTVTKSDADVPFESVTVNLKV